jgi:hypothetical protein
MLPRVEAFLKQVVQIYSVLSRNIGLKTEEKLQYLASPIFQ